MALFDVSIDFCLEGGREGEREIESVSWGERAREKDIELKRDREREKKKYYSSPHSED